jgi:hypothetical protein
MRDLDKRPVCEQIIFEPNTDPTGRHTGLSATTLRAPNIGRMLREAPMATARVTASGQVAPEGDPDDPVHWMRQRLAAASGARERGEEDPVRAPFRPRRQREAIPTDDRDLERVARIYSEAAALGQQPNKAVQAGYSVSRATASRWIRRARDLDLIPEPT